MPLALRFAQWISGARFNDVQPLKLLNEVEQPVLVVQADDDAFVSADDRAQVDAVAQRRTNISVWDAPGTEHLLAWSTHPDEYSRRVEEFCRSALSETPCPQNR